MPLLFSKGSSLETQSLLYPVGDFTAVAWRKPGVGNECKSFETRCLGLQCITDCLPDQGELNFLFSQVTAGNCICLNIHQQSCEVVFIQVCVVLNTSIQNVACFITVLICLEKLVQ